MNSEDDRQSARESRAGGTSRHFRNASWDVLDGASTARLGDNSLNCAFARGFAFSSSNESHWQTLAAFAQRAGIDHVAAQLTRYGDARGPTRAWWRCTLFLSMEIAAEDSSRPARELVAIEEAGGGPAFNCERHVLQVRGAIQYLEVHLQRMCAGAASSLEQSAAEMGVQAARIARARTAP